MGLDPYKITEEINRKNAKDLMRVQKICRYTGKMTVEYPSAVIKAQEGKTPAVAQKKIGSGAWSPAFPVGKAREEDDEEEDQLKKKDNSDRERGNSVTVGGAVNVLSRIVWYYPAGLIQGGGGIVQDGGGGGGAGYPDYPNGGGAGGPAEVVLPPHFGELFNPAAVEVVQFQSPPTMTIRRTMTMTTTSDDDDE